MKRTTPENGNTALAKLQVPGTPPSVNSYVRHARGVHYRTTGAKDWDEDVAICAKGQRVRAKGYHVTAVIYLGAGQKGDVDNFAKALLDSLVRSGVIDTDAKVMELWLRKGRDAKFPRTMIEVEGTA